MNAQPDQRTQTRSALRAMLLPAFFVVVFGICYISAFLT